jgi:Rrf2 family cysteine metabolism transcriptional repressor
MALLSRKVDYALLILSYLHHKTEGGCARIIADQFGLSRAFVANILKRLCNKGFVISQRGTKGGYVLHQPADEVYLTDVMDALDERFHLAECCQELADEGCIVFGVCPIKGPMAQIHHRIRDMLANITLAELVTTPMEIPVSLEVSRCQ